MASKMVELVEDDLLNGVVRYVNPTECHDAEPIGKMITDRHSGIF
jgi:hypothetical protein